MSEKYGFVYIWFDRKHKRYYIGSHWGTPDDGYTCSSSWMKLSYAKRPHDFKRRIVAKITESRDALLQEEQRWLDMIKSHEIKVRYYNLRTKAAHWIVDPVKGDDIRERISSGTKTAMADPEVRARYLEGLKKRPKTQTDETRRKRSESMKRAMANKFPERKVRDTFGSEAYRANMAEKTKALWAKEGYRERVGSKISESLKGKPHRLGGSKWWNDGVRNARAHQSPGDGWAQGRLNTSEMRT